MTERTPEERERARLEREARRAARARGEKPSKQGGSGVFGGLLRGRGGDEEDGSPRPPAAEPSPPAEPPRRAKPAPRAQPPRTARPAPESGAPEPPRVPEPPAAPEPPSAPEPPGRAQPPAAAEPPVPAEPPRAAEPSPEPEPPPAAAPPRAAEPPRAPAPRRRAESPRVPEPRRAPEPPRAPVPPRAAEPPRAGRSAPRVDLDRIRRLTRERRARAGEAGPPRTPGADAPAADRPRRRGPGRVLAGVFIAGVAVLLWLLFSIFQPFKGEGGGEVRVSIPTGAGVSDIADVLQENGVVSSATFFEIRTTIEGARGDLKPGVYPLREDMSYGAVIDALSAGPPDNIIRLVIPEGRSRSEVAQLVRDAGLEGDYERATRRSRILDPGDYGAERARNLEGFLWPATYELERGSSVTQLVNRQLRAFRENFDEVSMRRARRRNLTAYDVLIIASMVEREAMLDRERRLIASVIYNRLRRGEPLGIDATIRFATENWTEPLRQSDLQLDSPYNTRTNAGLPPTPIGSPGLESIQAAANPADTDYLFYVVKPNTCGEHEFSETLEEFEQDAARYNREREARGGRSPTDC